MAMFSRCDAQQAVGGIGQTPTDVVEFYQQHPKPAMSRDRLLMAHTGRMGSGLYLKNMKTGEDRRLEIENQLNCTDCLIDSIAISPDGGLIAFNVRWFVSSEGSTFSIRADGSELVQISPSESAEIRNRTDIRDLAFSPDGTKLLARVDLSGNERDKDGRDGEKFYVGILSADGLKQDAEKLAEGIPLFWSTDGTAIYYRDSASFYRLDITSKQSWPIADAHNRTVLGRVPESDAMFVGQAGVSFITILNLDGTSSSQRLKDFAANIPFRDANGRFLQSIEELAPHQFSLYYDLGFPSPNVNILKQHRVLVRFQ
jgi:hypothetical protein